MITTEFVFADGTVVDGPDLLEANLGQCGFILEDGDALVIGNPIVMWKINESSIFC